MEELILQIRQKLGPEPRSIGFLRYLQLKAWAPTWAWSDSINVIYKNQRALLNHGQVVWAHIVQANVLLFEPGADDCPALAIYGTSTSLDGDIELLEITARDLFSLKGTEPRDPELRIFADKITDEMSTPMKLKVPSSMTDGLDLFLTTIMVPRKHLPNRRLSLSFFPLLIAPKKTKATLIVPSQFWPRNFIRVWKQS